MIPGVNIAQVVNSSEHVSEQFQSLTGKATKQYIMKVSDTIEVSDAMDRVTKVSDTIEDSGAMDTVTREDEVTIHDRVTNTGNIER